MSSECAECGHPTEWEDALGSAICTSCGTLADASQNVLASHLDSNNENRGFEFYNWTGGNSTLKSIRNSNGWALAGQGKEARDRQNSFAMHAFIQTLCGRLANPGVAHRAQMIFDQARTRGNLRWGRRAKLTAGASIAIALRELHKSDSLRDISVLLDDSHISLSRAFTSIVTLLGLDLASADPSVHLSTLQTHLLHLISLPQTANDPNTLPKSLISVIKVLRPRFTNVMQTAHSLAALITQLGTLSHLPTPPTACAILLLALESEHRSSLPNCGVLAQALGARVGSGKGVIMQRYKVIYDIVGEWMRDVPWLEAHAGNGRYKTGKRAVVAKGLKDVVQFRDEIWRKKVENMGKVDVDLDLGEDAASDDTSDEATPPPVKKRKTTVGVPQKPVLKKRKTKHCQAMQSASQFLLNTDGSSDTSLLAHLLSSDLSTLSHAFKDPPTRLQMLAVSRAGGEASICDDELFDKGELENLLRTDSEVESYSCMVDWEQVEAEREQRRIERAAQRVRGKRKREAASGLKKQEGTKRIDMDALKRLMDPDSCLDTLVDDDKADEFFYFHDSEGAEKDLEPYHESPLGYPSATEEGEEDWRPVSPTVGFAARDFEQYEM